MSSPKNAGIKPGRGRHKNHAPPSAKWLAHSWGPNNPPPKTGGRPKVPEDVRRAFRELTPLAVDTLKRVMMDEDHPSAAAKAAEVVLDRAWGKAPVFVDGEIRFGKLSEEERKAKVEELIAKVEARCLNPHGEEEPVEAHLLGPAREEEDEDS